MGILPNIINVIGLILLTHAVYSAYEFSLPGIPPDPLSTTAASSSSTAGIVTTPKSSLPTDVTIETIVSVLLLCVGVVLGSPALKPSQWREWAGNVERQKRKPLKNLDDGVGGNPYLALEERSGFLDIRAERRKFAEWAKQDVS